MVRTSSRNRNNQGDGQGSQSVAPNPDSESNIHASKSDNSYLPIDLQRASIDEKLNYLCTQMSKLAVENEQLKKDSIQKDLRIKSLESRINDLEQYTRRDDIVITGIETPKSAYSNIVTSTSK